VYEEGEGEEILRVIEAVQEQTINSWIFVSNLFVSFRDKKTKFELGIPRASELFLMLKVFAKLQKSKFKLRFFKVT
jgi:hypothetical protein